MLAGALRQTHLLSCSLPLGCSCCPGQRLLLLLSCALLQGEPGHVPARVGRSLHGRLRQHAQPPCRPGAPVAVGPAAAARQRAAGRSRAREARADAALPISAGQASNFDRHSPRARRAGVPAAGVPVCRGRVHDAGGELPTAAHRAAQGAPRRPRRALLWAHGCRVSCCPAHERRLCGIGPPSSSLLPLAAGCQSVRMQAVWLLMRWRFLRNTFCLLLLGCRVPPRVNSPSRRPGSDNCPCCGVDASSSRAASGRRDGARQEGAAARRGSCWRALAGV